MYKPYLVVKYQISDYICHLLLDKSNGRKIKMKCGCVSS
jgi:hypothetical protein